MAEEDEGGGRVEQPTQSVSKLTDLLGSVSKVDAGGKQANPVTVIVLVVVLAVVIAGLGIALAISRRKAVKAQYEADKAKESATRVEADAKVAELAEEREALTKAAEALHEEAEAKEAEAAGARSAYEDLTVDLAAAMSWEDIKVTSDAE